MMIMQIRMSLDVTLCVSIDMYERFGGIYCLHLQGRNIPCYFKI